LKEVSQNQNAFYAHSANKAGMAQLLADHLCNVAELAAGFASVFGAADEAFLAGILHDLGKYSERFQRRLQGKEKGLDHWSTGAWCALKHHKMIAAALAIQGHHIGLQKADKDSLRALDPEKLSHSHPLDLELTETDIGVLTQHLRNDGIVPNSPPTSLYPSIQETSSALFDVRMLFSTLVDADFVDTAHHFRAEDEGEHRRQSGSILLQPELAMERLEEYIQRLSQTKESSPAMRQIRNELWQACLQAGDEPQGLWTLTAPTGAGKTLAMLGFALKHAMKHNLRRIIVVIPYLSIIEQTARVYQDVFAAHFDPNYLIEHHSMTGTRLEPAPDRLNPDAEEEAKREERLLAENWDAPIILTTSVQFLESLFSNRPSACRKLHRIAQSVILFDEVQTLPIRLAIPTLKILSRLAAGYGTTILFSTATQPAFVHLHEKTQEETNVGWQPNEIVKQSQVLFTISQRTMVEWHDLDARLSWRQVAELITQDEYQQTLCIVNLKRHAYELTQLLREMGAEGIFHLSTWMCPAHRQKVLETVRERLDKGQACRLISTQCVEAGVDIDFPVVFRAFAPLDSIAQAAGRCNRNGKKESGRVIVFVPEEDKYPPGAYEQAASVTRLYLRQIGIGNADIYDPSFFENYYRTLYDLANPELMSPELQSAIQRQDFVEVAKSYRLIDERSINLLVPWGNEMDVYETLREEVIRSGLRASWIRSASPYAVSLYYPRPDDDVWNYVQKVPIRAGYFSEEWFIYLEQAHYDDLMGLLPCKHPPVYLI
jgi:CRISPR-associated endonuclease/helicase Cas3